MAYNNFSDIKTILNNYVDEVADEIELVTSKIAEEGKNTLRSTTQPSQSSSGTATPYPRRSWNDYAKGWSVKKTKGRNYVTNTIHNKTNYQLTHLLENGHATRNGTTTRAFKHIEPVEKQCIESLEKQVKKIIEKGGKK